MQIKRSLSTQLQNNFRVRISATSLGENEMPNFVNVTICCLCCWFCDHGFLNFYSIENWFLKVKQETCSKRGFSEFENKWFTSSSNPLPSSSKVEAVCSAVLMSPCMAHSRKVVTGSLAHFKTNTPPEVTTRHGSNMFWPLTFAAVSLVET